MTLFLPSDVDTALSRVDWRRSVVWVGLLALFVAATWGAAIGMALGVWWLGGWVRAWWVG